MHDYLDRLLLDPEAKEHFHVFADDMSREIFFSIITKKKLEDLTGYTKIEPRIKLTGRGRHA